MKKFVAGLALGLSLMAAGASVTDIRTPISVDGIVVSTPPQSPPGNAPPTWRVIKEGTHNYLSLPALDIDVECRSGYAAFMVKPEVSAAICWMVRDAVTAIKCQLPNWSAKPVISTTWKSGFGPNGKSC